MIQPLVSVIMPAHNAATHISDAIQSVHSQRYDRVELIVIDDGSTDDTASLLDTFNDIIHLAQAHTGPAGGRNTGLKKATGDFIAFLDADDMWPVGKLERQVGYLIEHPEADVVIGLSQLIDPAGLPMGEPMLALQLGCGLFRAHVIDALKDFDEGFYYGEDLDFFMRIREMEQFKLDIRATTELYYRRHKGNMTQDRDATTKGLLLSLKHSLDRRRLSSDQARSLSELDLPMELIPAQHDEPDS